MLHENSEQPNHRQNHVPFFQDTFRSLNYYTEPIRIYINTTRMLNRIVYDTSLLLALDL